MAAEYEEAPYTVADIARQLIRDYHRYLQEMNIGFVFRKEAAVVGGREQMGSVSKVPPRLQFSLTDPLDFIIEIAQNVWGRLDSKQQTALIDHLLCRIDPGGKIVVPDIQEFGEIIDRYGLWTRELAAAGAAIQHHAQLELFPVQNTPFDHRGKVVTIEPSTMAGVTQGDGDSESGPLLNDAIVVAQSQGYASISQLQRHLRISYMRAVRLISEMQLRGFVGPEDPDTCRHPILGSSQAGQAEQVDMGELVNEIVEEARAEGLDVTAGSSSGE